MPKPAPNRKEESGLHHGPKFPDQAAEFAEIFQRTGLSRDALADLVGLDRATMRKYVGGYQKMGESTLALIREKTGRVTKLPASGTTTPPQKRMIADLGESGGSGGLPVKEEPAVYAGQDDTARMLSDGTIAEIIQEITYNEEIPAEERLKRLRPFQDELNRRIKNKLQK